MGKSGIDSSEKDSVECGEFCSVVLRERSFSHLISVSNSTTKDNVSTMKVALIDI